MRIYFKNLNGVRFIAAFLVILQHTTEYKLFTNLNLPNIFEHHFAGLGGYGVTLFFVLSGYLIFYLLFAEQEISHTIQIKNFYVRRILRIWPLYIGFGVILILGIDYILFKMLGTNLRTPRVENLIYLTAFSINLQMLFAIPNKGIIELFWSVCIEEQFYLFAPWMVKKGHKKMLILILALIFLGIASKFFMHYLEVNQYHDFNQNNPLYYFTICRFDNFGLGALAAYIHFKPALFIKVEKYVTNKWLQVVVVFLTLVYIFNFFPKVYVIEKYFFSTLPSVLFAYIILAASTGKFFVNLETPFLNLMGKYSYGIYVFHAVVSEIILYGFLKANVQRSILIYDFFYPLTCLIFTCIIAGLSYELYEKKFLKLKNRFALIKGQPV
ncbi:MAG: acyltransferase [Gloeobacteraceae cyanobacterium ES-bin-316]|nr:acyltransferase [Ferruginibacter sp.]